LPFKSLRSRWHAVRFVVTWVPRRMSELRGWTTCNKIHTSTRPRCCLDAPHPFPKYLHCPTGSLGSVPATTLSKDFERCLFSPPNQAASYITAFLSLPAKYPLSHQYFEIDTKNATRVSVISCTYLKCDSISSLTREICCLGLEWRLFCDPFATKNHGLHKAQSCGFEGR
jgi:hypothetical protein